MFRTQTEPFPVKPTHGFLDIGGSFTQIELLGATDTEAFLQNTSIRGSKARFRRPLYLPSGPEKPQGGPNFQDLSTSNLAANGRLYLLTRLFNSTCKRGRISHQGGDG